MQTFRPYLDHSRTAYVLDDRRLGKQRVEAKQVAYAILRKMGIIVDGRRGWLNHPVVLKWYNYGRPYLADLHRYFEAVVAEWVRRGHVNTLTWADLAPFKVGLEGRCPLSHIEEVEYRRVLLYKEPEWYLKCFTKEEVEEVLSTEPVYINGVNGSLIENIDGYRKLEHTLKLFLKGKPF
jgi:hypothetical protein